MEDLPEALFREIVSRITHTSDLNSLSLVSKRLYTMEAYQRSVLHVRCGLCPAREALASLCSRFPNLWKVEVDYSDWTTDNGNQLDNKGLSVISSCCTLLTDLTLSSCLSINDSAIGCLADCKNLKSVKVNSAPEITSSGLLAVAVGCKSLSALHLINCKKIESVEWLEYLGWNRSLEELVLKKCYRISQYDLLKFGPGWMKLQKFDFDVGFPVFNLRDSLKGFDTSYNAHNPSMYDFCCESLKDLRLACFEIGSEVGLRFLFGKCKALEKLCLQYVHGLNDNDMIVLSKSCPNLKSISLLLEPRRYNYDFTTAFTDISLKALALNCRILEAVELTFVGTVSDWPSEIGFTQEGISVLIQSCPIRVLVLNWADFFGDDGMKALSSAPFLETLELMACEKVTDAGMRFIARAPCLSNLTLKGCEKVTDAGVAELVHAHKLESLIIEACEGISMQATQGLARSVHYSESEQPGLIESMMSKWSGNFEAMQFLQSSQQKRRDQAVTD